MNTTKPIESILKSFNLGTFPPPYEFSDQEIEEIAAVPGTDPLGTFADAPMERALMSRYKLDLDLGENTWPAFALVLREEKAQRAAFIESEKRYAFHLNQIKEAIADCQSIGIPCKELAQKVAIAELTLRHV